MLTDYAGRNRKRYSKLPPDPAFNFWHRTLPGQVRSVDVDVAGVCGGESLYGSPFSGRQYGSVIYLIETKSYYDPDKGGGRFTQTAFMAERCQVPAYIAWTSLKPEFAPGLRPLERLCHAYELGRLCGCEDDYRADCDHGVVLHAMRLTPDGCPDESGGTWDAINFQWELLKLHGMSRTEYAVWFAGGAPARSPQ